MAGKGDIQLGVVANTAGVAAAFDAALSGAEGAAADLNKALGITVTKQLVVETFWDGESTTKGIRLVERDIDNLGQKIVDLGEKSKKLQFGSATSLKGQIREATQARDEIKRYEESVGRLGQRVRTVNADWAAQNVKVQDLSRQLSVASANGFWAQAKAGLNLQGLSNFSNGLVAVTQGLQSASILIGQVTASFNQLFTALAKIQQFELAFKAIGASASETSLAFQESERIATGLGVGIQTVRDAFQQLSPVILASGGSIGDVSAITESLSSRFSAFGLSADQSRRVMNGVIQAFGKGKLMAEELTQQISEADPAFRVDLASAIGVTVAQLGEMVKAGEITSDRLIDILPLLSKSSLLFGKLGDSGASAVAALGKGTVTITQVRTQLETLNQLSFERLAGSLEPFLVALLRVQAAVVDFGTAISSSTALKAFGEFLGQVVSQAGGVIDVIGKIALTFLSIVEAVGIVINTIDNFTEKITAGIGGVRVVVTALATLITAKLVVALVQLGATLVGTVVRGLAALTASAAASGGGIKGIAAAITGNIASFIGLDAATKKLIASNYQLVASTGGVTAALQGAAVAAKTAAASLIGAGGKVKITGLDSIAKEATAGAQALGTLTPAAQSVAQSTQLAIPGLTATGKAITGLGTATQLAIPGFAAAGEATKAYTKGTMALYLASVEGAGGVAKVAGAAQAGLPAFVPFTAAIEGAKGAAAGLGPAGAAGALGVGAAGVAAGAATAPTLTFAGAVAAAQASMASAAVAAGAFIVAALPVILVGAAIAGLVVAVLALNGAFSGSDASIKAFDAGIEGIKERSDKAIAAIDAAGDSAADFEERLNSLEVTNDFGGELAKQLAGFPPMVRKATQEFEKMEKISADSFKGAEKAVANYNKEQDKSGKGALKVAQYVSDAEDTIQQALQATKQKRAELEAAAKASGGTISADNKRLLEGYNENVKALERKKQAVEDLKRSAVGKGIEIPITTVDKTKATLDGIKSKIETLKSNIVLELDPAKLDSASSKLEFLKYELEFLEKDRYQVQVEVAYEINKAALEAQLSITDAQKANLEAQVSLQQALLSVDEARLTVQEEALTKQIEWMKENGASAEEIYKAELKLKGLAAEKLELKKRAVQAELDALPKIQEAERASLNLQQQIAELELDKAKASAERLKSEAQIALLQSQSLLNEEKNKEKPDQGRIDELNKQVELREKILTSIDKEIASIDKAKAAQTELNAKVNDTLRLKQEGDKASLNAKAIEAGISVDAKGAAPDSVKVPIEFVPPNENDLERQIRELSRERTIKFTPNTDEVKEETRRFEDQNLEIDSSVKPPETSEAQRELDELQKGGLRIDTSLEKPDTTETYATIEEVAAEQIEIISNIAPPDPAPVTSTVEELNNENVEIGAEFEVPGTEGVLKKVGELEDVDVEIQSGINPPDTNAVSDKIDELQGGKVEIPSGIENPDTSSIDQIREDNEGTPIEIPVNVGDVQGADGLTNLDGGSLKITPVIGELDTTEVEGRLEGLGNLVPAITPVVEVPDTSEAEGVLQDLEGASPVIPLTLGQLDDSSLRADLDAFDQTGLEIDTSLGSLDVSQLNQELDALKGDISIPASIQPKVENESEVEVTLSRLARPIESTATYRIENEAELASTLDEAFRDRDINVGADTTEAEQAVTNLEEREGVINLSFGAPDDREVEQQIGELEQRKVEVQTSLEALNTDEAYSKISNLEEETVDIASSIKPPDTAPTEAEIERLNGEKVRIETGLNVPDDRDVQAKVQEVESSDVQIPSSILDPNLSGIDETRKGLEGDPIVIPVKVGPVEGGDSLAGPEGKTIEIKTVLDTTDADRKLKQLGTPPPEVSPIVTTPDTSEAQAAIDRVGETVVEIEPVLKSVDDSLVKGQLDDLRGSDVTIDSRLGPLDESEATRGLDALREQGIDVPVRIDSNVGQEITNIVREIGEPEILFQYRIKNEAELDRAVARADQLYTIEFGANAVEVERKLLELEERKRMIQFGVVSEPGELEKINSEISKLEQQKRIIQVEYDKPDPMALQELAKAGINVPVKLETVEVESELKRLEERKRQIQFGVASEPGELQAVENQLRELEERKRVIQVAYDSPNPEAINQLGRDLEARNLQLKTSLQTPDPTQVNAELSRLGNTQVQFKSTVAPLPTEATRAQAAALATTPVQLKSTVAPLPTEPTKAEAAALAATLIEFKPTVAPVPVEEAKAKLSELGDTQVVITPVVNPPDTTVAKTELTSLSAPVNVPLTVSANTVQAKTALTEVRTEGDAIQFSLDNATQATAALGGKAQEAVSPFGALGTASANLLQSSNTIDQNFAGIGSAATAAVTPMGSLDTSLAGASTNALAAATSVGNLSTNASGAAGVFGELLTQTTGISDSAAKAAESTDLIKTGFDNINTAATTAATATSTISENLNGVEQSTSDAATSGETLATAFNESVSNSSILTTNTANVATEANRAATQTDAMYLDIRDSVGVTSTLIGKLNAAASAASRIRIPTSSGRFAGGPVQGGGAYTVNEFGKEMFLSNSGKLSQINTPAWGTWRAPSSGTIIPAHIAAGIDIPKGGVKVSKPGGGLSSSSVKKNGSGLGRVIANLVNALNASKTSQKNNDNAIQATQAIQIGKLTQAVNKLVDKDWNVGVNIQGQNGGLSYARAINRKI